MKEYDFIKSLENSFRSGVEGIGDDAVLYKDILISNDVLAENVHFLSSTPVEYVISKLFTSNISDIASMGGTADSVLLGMALKDSSMLERVLSAVQYECKRYNVNLIGGDTSSSKSSSFFSLTVTGNKNKSVIGRNGAKSGDNIYISRPVGLCRISLEKELMLNDFNINKYYHYQVRAEDRLGSFLGSLDKVTSMTDISDGLISELYNISEKSKVKMMLEYDLLDLSHLSEYNVNSFEYFITSGEEYSLLFTVPEKKSKELEYLILKETGKKIYKIGSVEKGSGVYLKNSDGTEEILSNSGYEHFK